MNEWIPGTSPALRSIAEAKALLRINFEVVHPTDHPEYYEDSTPCVSPGQIPDDHWKPVERVGQAGDVYEQLHGLVGLMLNGELIRRVRLGPADTRKVNS